MLMSGEKQYDNTIIHLFTNIKVAMKRKLRLSLLSYCDMPSWTKKNEGRDLIFLHSKWIGSLDHCGLRLLRSYMSDKMSHASFVHFWFATKNSFKRATAEWTVEHLRATLWRYWMNQCCWTNLLDEWFNGSLERQSLVSSLNDILTASGNLVSWLVASLPYQAMIRYTSRNWFQTDFWCNETV